MNTTVKITRTNISSIVVADKAPVLPNSNVEAKALGISATIPENMIINPPIEYDTSQDSQSLLFQILRILLTGNQNANLEERIKQVQKTALF